MEAVYQEKVLEVEPFGVEAIPREERHGRVRQLFSIWFASNLNVVTWFTGFLGISFGLSLRYAILAIVIGNLLGGAFLAMASAIGPKLGQPLVPGSQRAFGRTGVIGLSVLNLVNNIGWLGVNLVLAVMALQKIIPSLGYRAALLILAALIMLVAVYGYNFIHTLANWMSLVIGLLFALMTVVAVSKFPLALGGTVQAAGGFSWGIFILAVAIAFSYQISYCPIGSDYSRYMRKDTSIGKAWLAGYLGCVSVCIWLEILGALTATLGLKAAPMDFFAKLMGPLTIPALMAVIFSIMPINVMAAYSGGLAALAMGVPLKRWVGALATTALAVLLGSFGEGQLADTYKNFLLLISYWIAPWLGVVLADFFLRRSKRLAVAKPSSGWIGILSCLLGMAVSIPLMSSALYTGAVAKNWLGGADISYFVSMLVSVVVYLVLKRVNAARIGKP